MIALIGVGSVSAEPGGSKTRESVPRDRLSYFIIQYIVAEKLRGYAALSSG